MPLYIVFCIYSILYWYIYTVFWYHSILYWYTLLYVALVICLHMLKYTQNWASFAGILSVDGASKWQSNELKERRRLLSSKHRTQSALKKVFLNGRQKFIIVHMDLCGKNQHHPIMVEKEMENCQTNKPSRKGRPTSMLKRSEDRNDFLSSSKNILVAYLMPCYTLLHCATGLRGIGC